MLPCFIYWAPELFFQSFWELLCLISDPRASVALGLTSSGGCLLDHGSLSSWQVMVHCLWAKVDYDDVIVGINDFCLYMQERYSVYVHLVNMDATQSVVLECWNRILEASTRLVINLLNCVSE